MFTRIRNLHPVTGIVIGVVATLVLSGTAMAVTDTSFTYSTTQTGYLTIHPMDLTPAGNFDAANYSVAYGPAYLFTSSSFACFNTGVNLPQLSKHTTVQTYYTGSSGAQTVYLVRNNLSTDVTDYLVYQNMFDTDGVRKSVTNIVDGTQRTVRNNVWSYGFGICMGVADRFEGARITYTYTTAGD